MYQGWSKSRGYRWPGTDTWGVSEAPGQLAGKWLAIETKVSFLTKQSKVRAYVAFLPPTGVSCQFPDYGLWLPYISLSS